MRLPYDFFTHDTVIVAQRLIGMHLVHQIGTMRLSGIIVETEAYRPDDPACHAFKGKNSRNASLFGPVGRSYVYRSYGIHYCVNVVAHAPDYCAGGVLIRALEPVDGIENMQHLRGTTDLIALTSGPGKVTQALGITLAHDGINLMESNEFYLEYGTAVAPDQIVAAPRIGISKAVDHLWRFYIARNPHVSRYTKGRLLSASPAL